MTNSTTSSWPQASITPVVPTAARRGYSSFCSVLVRRNDPLSPVTEFSAAWARASSTDVAERQISMSRPSPRWWRPSGGERRARTQVRAVFCARNSACFGALLGLLLRRIFSLLINPSSLILHSLIPHSLIPHSLVPHPSSLIIPQLHEPLYCCTRTRRRWGCRGVVWCVSYTALV